MIEHPQPTSPASDVDPTNVLGRRILAHCIDLAVLMAIVIPMMLTTSKIHNGVASDFCSTLGAGPGRCVQSGNVAIELGAGGSNVFTAVIIVYWVIVGVLEGMTGAFLGKRALGLRVIAAEGGRAGAGRGALRGLLMFIDSTFCFLIGLVTVLMTHPRRRIGDMAARTLVVPADTHLHTHGGADPIEWDEHRGAYVYTDPASGHQLRWDEATNAWVPRTDDR